nr:unnamed protein product [Callosobruchus analis]
MKRKQNEDSKRKVKGGDCWKT